MAAGGEKTEKASPKKRQDERKKGNIFMSKDITVVVSLLIAFYGMSMFIGSVLDNVSVLYSQQMQRAVMLDTLAPADVMKIFQDLAAVFVVTILPAMMIIGLGTVLIVGAQTKFIFSKESLKFKFDRLDPLKGVKRLVSIRSVVELVKSLIKITVIIYILYGSIRGDVELMPEMFDWELSQAISFTGKRILEMVVTVGIAFGAIAALDFLYQRWEYERNIKMTKQEVKDEYKQMEGNPEVKSARRQKQREYAQKRMMSQVQDADVIVRNPTHFAVALRYDLDKDPAPMVLAKGQDAIALKIVEIGEKHGVMTVENKPLARGLYELSDIDEMIPPELFQPVAELLAWIYSAKQAKQGE